MNSPSKLCIDCNHFVNSKPMPRCNASKFTDLVTGDDKRTCMIERLDGIGRCSSMGNNFQYRGEKPKVVRKNPAVVVKK